MVKLTVIFAIVLFLAGCGGSDRDVSEVVDEREVESAESIEQSGLYGVWRGLFESEYNGFTDAVTLVFDGTDVYLMNYNGGTAVGVLAISERGYVAQFNLYEHYPVRLQLNYRTPYLGKISGKTLEVNFQVDGNEVISGRYTELSENAAVDVGVFSSLKQEISGGTIDSVNDGRARQFPCGSDGGYDLYCYSIVNVVVEADGSLRGEYYDYFKYQDRLNIPLTIPSSRSFHGYVNEVKELKGLFRYSFFITDSGQGEISMSGIGWDSHFIAVSTGASMMYTFSDFIIY